MNIHHSWRPPTFPALTVVQPQLHQNFILEVHWSRYRTTQNTSHNIIESLFLLTIQSNWWWSVTVYNKLPVWLPWEVLISAHLQQDCRHATHTQFGSASYWVIKCVFVTRLHCESITQKFVHYSNWADSQPGQPVSQPVSQTACTPSKWLHFDRLFPAFYMLSMLCISFPTLSTLRHICLTLFTFTFYTFCIVLYILYCMWYAFSQSIRLLVCVVKFQLLCNYREVREKVLWPDVCHVSTWPILKPIPTLSLSLCFLALTSLYPQNPKLIGCGD